MKKSITKMNTNLKFISLIKEGNLDKVNSFLLNMSNLNFIENISNFSDFDRFSTPLSIAFLSNNSKIVNLLIDKGAKIFFIFDHIYDLCYQSNPNLINLLIKFNIIKFDTKKNMLIQIKNLKIYSYLIEVYINITKNNLDLVEEISKYLNENTYEDEYHLLDRLLDMYFNEANIVLERKENEILCFLDESISDLKNIIDEQYRKLDLLDSNNLILNAIRNKNYDLITLLLDNGYELNDSNKIFFYINNDYEMLQFLINNGLKISGIKAVESFDDYNCVKLLLKQGAIIGVYDLDKACSNKNIDILDLYLNLNIPIEIINTSIFNCFRFANLDMIHFFEKRGFKITLRDSYYHNFSISNKVTNIPQNFIVFCLMFWSRNSYIRKKDDLVKVFQKLLDIDSNVNQISVYYDYSALHFSILIENIEIIEILLEKGADPNKQEYRDKMTPLYMSLCKNRSDIAKLLIKYGAKPEISNKYESSSLHKLLKKVYSIDLLLSFIKTGTDLNIRDKVYKNLFPLDIAYKKYLGKQKKEVISLLRNNGARGELIK
jgi:ankyrin repeat protein